MTQNRSTAVMQRHVEARTPARKRLERAGVYDLPAGVA